MPEGGGHTKIAGCSKMRSGERRTAGTGAKKQGMTGRSGRYAAGCYANAGVKVGARRAGPFSVAHQVEGPLVWPRASQAPLTDPAPENAIDLEDALRKTLKTSKDD